MFKNKFEDFGLFYLILLISSSVNFKRYTFLCNILEKMNTLAFLTKSQFGHSHASQSSQRVQHWVGFDSTSQFSFTFSFSPFINSIQIGALGEVRGLRLWSPSNCGDSQHHGKGIPNSSTPKPGISDQIEQSHLALLFFLAMSV